MIPEQRHRPLAELAAPARAPPSKNPCHGPAGRLGQKPLHAMRQAHCDAARTGCFNVSHGVVAERRHPVGAQLQCSGRVHRCYYSSGLASAGHWVPWASPSAAERVPRGRHTVTGVGQLRMCARAARGPAIGPTGEGGEAWRQCARPARARACGSEGHKTYDRVMSSSGPIPNGRCGAGSPAYWRCHADKPAEAAWRWEGGGVPSSSQKRARHVVPIQGVTSTSARPWHM